MTDRKKNKIPFILGLKSYLNIIARSAPDRLDDVAAVALLRGHNGALRTGSWMAALVAPMRTVSRPLQSAWVAAAMRSVAAGKL